MTAASIRERGLAQQPVWWVIAALILACALIQLGTSFGGGPAPAVFAVVGALIVVQLAILGAIAALLARTRPLRPTPDTGSRRDPRRRLFGPDLMLSAVAIAWGATVVPVVAAHANTQNFTILHKLGLRSIAASIAAPLDEDLLRFAGILGILTIAAAFSDARGGLTPLDGLRYGFLVGAGFEVAENANAVLDGATGVDNPLAAALQLALVRTGLGFGLHALWAGIAGAALASCLARRRAGRSGGWWILVPAVLTPMILHSLWDAPALSIDLGAKMALLAAVYAVTLALFAAVWICAGRSDTRRGRDDPAELQRSDAIELLDTAQHPDQEDRG